MFGKVGGAGEILGGAYAQEGRAWPLWTAHLRGSVVKRHIEHVRLLPGPVGTENIIGVLHRVHQNHHLDGTCR